MERVDVCCPVCKSPNKWEKHNSPITKLSSYYCKTCPDVIMHINDSEGTPKNTHTRLIIISILNTEDINENADKSENI